MSQTLLRLLLLPFLFLSLTVTVPAGPPGKSEAPDLSKQPTLYVVPYAHLDTEWRWEYPTTISEYILHTMRDNFALFEKYPHYLFNFSGANRYRMMKEYFPADFKKVQHYVDAGRWFVAGSSMEENDVNNPSAESIIRQILYGKEFFRREFGRTSAEYMLPDCFGFPASLPSILAHMGLKGFSTQKLSWHSGARVGGPGSPQDTPPGIPFNVGFWEGPDGKGVIAALNATAYGSDVTEDLTKSETWRKRVQEVGESSGVFADYRYYGTGDVGGAPREPSVKLMEAILDKSVTVIPPPRRRRFGPPEEEPAPGPAVKVGDGPLNVLQATAEQMFLDIKPDQAARLPRYKGDLELTEHSAGSLTSEAMVKQWNRENERLADAAEKASVAAALFGGLAYPMERLTNAWTLVMGNQFHDIIPGTATPKAYEFAWNDQVLAMNQFAGVLAGAAASIASGMDTQAKGTAVVVYNPLNIEREDVVEADLPFPNAPKSVRVVAPDGRSVPGQIEGGKILFLAKVPSTGFAVYDVQPAQEEKSASELRVTESKLENARYAVTIDKNGDVSSVFDKSLGKELLSSPIRLAINTDKPVDWPAWNMDWSDEQAPPRAYVGGPASIRIVENGPVRIAVEVAREAEGSKFVQTIRLAAGDAGNRVEFGNVIDWKTPQANLKATFPLSASNPEATYNWDIGAIRRANDDEKKYEVASHQWFDLTDKSGAYGVTILSGSKNGSDKPADNTLRLTLLRTPGIGTGNGRNYSDQTSQDWGHHEFVYGMACHAGDWASAQTEWQAWRLDQPLIAFESPKHTGPLGRSFSLLKVSSNHVRVLALKKAEKSDEIIVRMVELDGEPDKGVKVSFATPVSAAREVNGAEEPAGAATVAGGELVTSFGPFEPRTFALKLAAPRAHLAAPRSAPVTLPYDLSVASHDDTKSAPGFDSQGHALPAEMLPARVVFDGVAFDLPPASEGKPDALVAKGQTLNLPGGTFNRLYVLAASDGDQKAIFRAGGEPAELNIQNWTGFIGQWDDRTWNIKQEPWTPPPGMQLPPNAPRRMRTVMEFTGAINPGYTKPANVAWFASHHHTADGANQPYAYSYLFAYPIDLSANARTLTLPDNQKIRILAITAALAGPALRPLQPLIK